MTLVLKESTEFVLKHIIDNAEVGQLWELNEHWSRVMDKNEAQTYLLLRQIGDTNVWDALCIETSQPEVLTLSSLLYELVV